MNQVGVNLVRLSSAFVLWVLISILRRLRVVKLDGWDYSKFSPGPEGLIVIFRHPSYFMEVWYLPALLFPQYWRCPSKMPLVVADLKNFGKRRYWVFRPMMILMDRRDDSSKLGATLKIRRHLRNGGIVYIAPGGGRERTGKKYKILLPNGAIKKIDRPDGNFNLRKPPTLRRFELGMWSLVRDGAAVVIIWVEPRDFLGIARVVIGEPHYPDLTLSKEGLADSLENGMLQLAVR